MAHYFHPFSRFLSTLKAQNSTLWPHLAQKWRLWLYCTCLCHQLLKRELFSINTVMLCAATRTRNSFNDALTSGEVKIKLTFSLSLIYRSSILVQHSWSKLVRWGCSCRPFHRKGPLKECDGLYENTCTNFEKTVFANSTVRSVVHRMNVIVPAEWLRAKRLQSMQGKSRFAYQTAQIMVTGAWA